MSVPSFKNPDPDENRTFIKPEMSRNFSLMVSDVYIPQVQGERTPTKHSTLDFRCTNGRAHGQSHLRSLDRQISLSAYNTCTQGSPSLRRGNLEEGRAHCTRTIGMDRQFSAKTVSVDLGGSARDGPQRFL